MISPRIQHRRVEKGQTAMTQSKSPQRSRLEDLEDIEEIDLAVGDAPGETASIGSDRYTMAEAAKLKGVSYHTVSRAVRKGRLPVLRLGRMALISADDLRAWRPMRERAPRRYRGQQVAQEASPIFLDTALGKLQALAKGSSAWSLPRRCPRSTRLFTAHPPDYPLRGSR